MKRRQSRIVIPLVVNDEMETDSFLLCQTVDSVVDRLTEKCIYTTTRLERINTLSSSSIITQSETFKFCFVKYKRKKT